MVIAALLRTTAVMLLSAALWSLIGLGYNLFLNEEALRYVWHRPVPGEIRGIETAKLDAYEKVQGICLVTGLITGLGVSLVYRRQPNPPRA